MVSPICPPEFDLTVRVGCSLAYEVTGTASLLLNVRPRPDRHHVMLAEALTMGDNLPAEEFTDSHGNPFYRVTLAPGTNLFRHDAIVAISSKPDNHDLDGAAPLAPGELPTSVLRYTLPSRYCDSDKLVNFAWGTSPLLAVRLSERFPSEGVRLMMPEWLFFLLLVLLF